MKERPILFSAPMVRAILDGRKTQTRRVFGPAMRLFAESYDVEKDLQLKLCPYGQPGDHLWVRESFWGCDAPGYGDTPCVVYDDEWHGKVYRPAEVRPWAPRFGRIPSIHMPRNFSRITLEVTGVRAERLQEINEQDAIAEGVEPYAIYGGKVASWKGSAAMDAARETARDAYRDLWDSLNAARGFGWDVNPWVWAVAFKRIGA
ncbi:hypothetical protein [Paraburkholderia sacchari]|uniref:hypothetical protein n=1 Tax=Paraburkholderia sacchari TaxID=159450 RepID=UPI001BCDC2DA|nr:hypothetical protein [Paraburkholderia sacchari]